MDYEVEMGNEMLRLYKSKCSKEYAIHSLILYDLEFTRECLLELIKIIEDEKDHNLISEALFNAALIRLYSCFDGNKALSKDVIELLPLGAREVYTFFKNYRDKHISHKVNPVDQMKPGIILSSVEKKGVIAVGCFGMKDMSFIDPSFIDSSLTFVNALIEYVRETVKRLEREFLREAQAENIDELYNLPSVKVVVPNSDYLHKNKR
ncbi:MAG: hypothetical protein AB2672_13365 [Candidatus Thiodiazotropha endolucinida]